MIWNIDASTADEDFESAISAQLAAVVERTDISSDDRRVAIASAAFVRGAVLGLPIGSGLVAHVQGDLADDTGYGTVTISVQVAALPEALLSSVVLDHAEGDAELEESSASRSRRRK